MMMMMIIMIMIMKTIKEYVYWDVILFVFLCTQKHLRTI